LFHCFFLLGLDSARSVSFNVFANWIGAPNGSAELPTGLRIVATGGDVMVIFLGPTGAYYDESSFVVSPSGTSGDFFENHSTVKGTAIDLGYYAAGTEILFGIHVADSSQTYYTGPGDRNPDGAVHAFVQNDWQGVSGLTYIGFEDMYANLPADWGYVDEVIAVTGAVGSVPETSPTILLLAASFCALIVLYRRSL
jgi:hypothetical protein